MIKNSLEEQHNKQTSTARWTRIERKKEPESVDLHIPILRLQLGYYQQGGTVMLTCKNVDFWSNVNLPTVMDVH